MPEGDTLYRVAAAMRPHLLGRRLNGFVTRDRAEVAGLRGALVHEIATLGKHLLLVLRPRGGEDWVLHTHLGMPGRWRGERGGPSCVAMLARGAGVSFEVPRESDAHRRRWSCLHPPIVELFRRSALPRHPKLTRLGPDLLAPGFRPEAVVDRARRSPATSVAELLLDQRVACGAGNVYKNEVLFLSGLDPRCSPGGLSDDALVALFRECSRQLVRNSGPGRRSTRDAAERVHAAAFPSRFYVYGRQGQPCLRCGSPIRKAMLGETPRVTYWCTTCQVPRPAMPPFPRVDRARDAGDSERAADLCSRGDSA